VIDVLDLPFDQYQRYQLAADLLEEVRPKGARWRVLDVGGRTALLRSFLPNDDVVLVDLEVSEEPRLVLGDGSELPFADGSFDVVTAFDTLEHVPPRRRKAFVDELRRVARRHVLLVGPYQGPEVEEAELLLQRFMKDKLGVEHRYLEEHRRHGLPDRAAVEKQLAASGAKVASVAHGNLERWLALICASMYMDYSVALRPIAKRFFRFYNANLYRSDHAQPVYRHAVVAAIGKSPLPSGKGALTRPEMPAGGVARITEMAFEVVDFERVLAEERRKTKEHVDLIVGMERELARHRHVVTDILPELERMRVEIAKARDLLLQNDATIADLRAQMRSRWKNLRRAFGRKPRLP
jgi:SAM-dependent methyltransferase